MSDPGASPICLLHLVRGANGRAPFDAFLAALGACDAGTQFELVLAFKGFASEDGTEPFLEAAADLQPQALHFDDSGFDVGLYLASAGHLGRDRYCFLNSFSEPLVDGWLQMLDAALAEPGVGMAGATGSWNSTRDWALQLLGAPTRYRHAMPPRPLIRKVNAELAAASGEDGETDTPAHGLAWTRARTIATALARLPRQTFGYLPFPSPHLRTNAFCAGHATLAALHGARGRTKRDAYLLESGRDGLTRQVERLGLRSVVVDRHGRAYTPDDWDRSATFWQRGQEGLLVADNQTRSYQQGGFDRRRVLATMAWGARAEPLPPGGEPALS